jgi:hypothetical protein
MPDLFKAIESLHAQLDTLDQAITALEVLMGSKVKDESTHRYYHSQAKGPSARE